MTDLEHEAARGGRRRQFHELRPLLTGEDTTVGAVAAQLEMNEGAVRVAVHRLRRRFGELLRDRIAETVDSDDAIEDELRHLLDAVAAPAP
jgi:RNA polymerase sigma-70 factor (ECF subfamily)